MVGAGWLGSGSIVQKTCGCAKIGAYSDLSETSKVYEEIPLQRTCAASSVYLVVVSYLGLLSVLSSGREHEGKLQRTRMREKYPIL